MTAAAAVNSNTRAIPAGETRAATSSTLLCSSLPGKRFFLFWLQCSEWTRCEYHPSCGSGEFLGIRGKFLQNRVS